MLHSQRRSAADNRSSCVVLRGLLDLIITAMLRAVRLPDQIEVVDPLRSRQRCSTMPVKVIERAAQDGDRLILRLFAAGRLGRI
jgi:hypothetical protein